MMLPPATRAYLACGFTDMRRGFDGLAAQVQTVLSLDPNGGALFVFQGRRGDLLKALHWDGQGLCLYAKRLELPRARFVWPQSDSGTITLTAAQVSMLFEPAFPRCLWISLYVPTKSVMNISVLWRIGRTQMEHPAGESDDGSLRVDFDRRLRLEFHGSRVTSDAGLLAYRELDDAIRLTDLAGAALSECRRGKNTRHLLSGLLRQSVFGRLAGYEDVNDADRLAHDPAMRAVVHRSGLDRHAASTSHTGRFETEWLTSEANLATLADLSGAWIDQVHALKPHTTIVLDMDSSVSETHGAQEGSAYNGHFGCTCYHPLFVFNQFGDLERCSLRPGNVHSAADWRDVLEPVVARYRHRMKRRYFRGDAAYANPGIYEFLEAEGYKFSIRQPTNAVLQQRIGWL